MSLQNAITDFRGFASLTKDTPPSLTKLYNWLHRSHKAVSHHSCTGIVPNGVLHYLPFAALSADGKSYLSDDYVLFSLPSASTLPYVQSKEQDREKAQAGKTAANQTLLAMSEGEAQGLPALQNADKEAQAVASLYDVQALTGQSATEQAFRDKAGESYIIHVAAHGQLNTASPLFSRVVLAPSSNQDGSLEVHEVYELDLHSTDLVVLSACQTDLGAQSKGDDIVGLNRAFIYAGTPSVIASLWSVDDQATSMLMTSFYTHLKAGEGKAEALRSAQQETRGKYPNPYYWAAFVLSGSPGNYTGDASNPSPTLGAALWAAGAVVGTALLIGGALLIRARRRSGAHHTQ